jgi:hypothetical protein
MWAWGRKQNLKHPLDKALFNWTKYDPFRVRDLLAGGVAIFGRSSSGKTSSSGRTVMQAIVDHPDSAGLCVAAKPEDAQDVRAILHTARSETSSNTWKLSVMSVASLSA